MGPGAIETRGHTISTKTVVSATTAKDIDSIFSLFLRSALNLIGGRGGSDEIVFKSLRAAQNPACRYRCRTVRAISSFIHWLRRLCRCHSYWCRQRWQGEFRIRDRPFWRLTVAWRGERRLQCCLHAKRSIKSFVCPGLPCGRCRLHVSPGSAEMTFSTFIGRCAAWTLHGAVVMSLVSCGATLVDRNKHYGATGLISDRSRCSGACLQKVTTDSGEMCVIFQKGVADICLADQGKVMPPGSYLTTNPN